MKFLKSLFFAAICLSFIISCEKEYSFEDGGGVSGVGTLKSDAFGNCLPSTLNGIYKADSTLAAGNYVDVQVNVITPGSYIIVSDTVNGYYFKGTGTFISVGLTTIKLQGIGKPLNAGSNDFIISLNGSECFINVTVIGSSASVGNFTLGGAPGGCTGASASGTYTQGVALTSSNTLTVSVNATALGAYSLAASSANGMTFTTSGTFTVLGSQPVTLVGSGTPTTSGAATITVAKASGNCTFSIPVGAATGTTAVYTLGGAGASCTGVVINGTYKALTAMTAANTALFNVNVTTIGTYTITSTAVNGVTFSRSGTFTATGAQTVTLTASGTPAVAGAFNYPTTGNASTCAFPVTFTAASSAAVFTLQGAPGVCAAAVISGTYNAGTALASSNTVTIQANVTTAGSYSITAPALNGMTFSASGTFPGTGPQPIVLVGTGTPVAAGTNVFTTGTGSTCTFNIIVGSGAPTNFINATINGTATTFNANIFAAIDITTFGFPILTISGETNAGADPYFEFGIAKPTGGSITAATYNVNQIASGNVVGAYYFDAAAVEYLIESMILPQTPGFSITISSITATRVMGTFFGTVTSAGGVTRTITSGSFSVPL